MDEDYTALENELAQTVANIESTHPGYDEYRLSLIHICQQPACYVPTVWGQAANKTFSQALILMHTVFLLSV